MKKSYKIILIYVLVLLLFNIGIYTKILFLENDLFIFSIINAIITIVSTCVLIYIYQKKELKPEYFFLIIAITFGIFYVIATPMFKGHDESAHWYKSYATSIFEFKQTVNEEGKKFVKLPGLVEEVTKKQGSYKSASYAKEFVTWKYLKNSIEQYDTKRDVDVTVTSAYNPIMSIPQATGIAIARTLGLNIYIQAYAGRICNLLLFAFAGFFAIKILPSKKLFLVAILLSPKIFYTSTTLSMDVFTNSVCILFISYIFYLKHNKVLLNWKNIILLCLLILGISISKVVYFPLCMLVLILPKEVFKSAKCKIIFCTLVILLSCMIGLLGIKFSGGSYLSNDHMIKQTEYVLQHPFMYIGYTAKNTYEDLLTWGEDLVGNTMDWNNSNQPELLTVLVFIVLILSLTIEKNGENKDFKRSDYFIMIIISFIVFCGIISTMYLTYTSMSGEIGGINIIGIQGRYFMPIILLLVSLVPIRKIEAKDKIDIIWLYVLILLWQTPTLINIFANNLI